MSELDDVGVVDLVRERLPPSVPQRPQVADVTGEAVDGVGELAQQRLAHTDRLADLGADELQTENLLATVWPVRPWRITMFQIARPTPTR